MTAAVARLVATASPVEGVRLLRAEVEPDQDGVPVLLAVYRHPHWEKTTGMRRRLDRRPASGEPMPGQSCAEWFADWIVNFEIGEPLGTRYDTLVPDGTGVWWWGDGVT